MPEYCTCGTQLVEGARFCHKCGRPTSEEPEFEREALPVTPPSPPRMVLTPPVLPRMVEGQVTFGNPTVLRVAFAAAALSIVLDSIPRLGVLFIFWAMASGFVAAWLYIRRTGLALSVSSGAKLGWITGVLAFLISAVMATFAVVLSGDKITDEFRRQVTETWSKDPNFPQMLHILDNPSTLASVIAFGLLVFFVLMSVASIAGGALGARLSSKQ